MLLRLPVAIVSVLTLCVLSLQGIGQTVTPPILLSPSNGDTIQMLYPVFNWSAVSFPGGGVASRYEIRIVEVLSGQSPEAAIQANPDWFSNLNVSFNTFAYTPAAPLLKKGSRYAWQVSVPYQYNQSRGEAQATGNTILKSEVFSFVFNDPMSDEACVPLLFKKLDNRFYSFTQYLNFQLPTEIAADSKKMVYSITDSRNAGVASGNLLVTAGQKKDQYRIDVGQIPLFRKKSSKGKFYILNARNPAGKTYYLKFTIR